MKKRANKVGKFVYWTPRILSILFLAFLTLFSFDVFGNGYTFWETVVALLMHNIPVFILLAVLLVAWKYEIVGGIAYILAGFAYMASLMLRNQFEWYMISWSMTIAGPAFFIGILFLIGWFKKRK